MRLKAEYDSINAIGTYFVEESKELENNINDINRLIEELSKYWKGTDYETFKNNSTSNMTNVINTAIEFNAFGNALKKISRIYGDIDNDFGTKLKRVKDHE